MLKKITFLILLSTLFIIPLLAQQTRSTGLIPNKKDYQNVPLISKYEGEKYDMLAPRVDLKPYCPAPGDQGNTGSCVAWALGHGALTIDRAIANQQTNTDVITLGANSASFIYNQIKVAPSCSAGAKFSDALRLLQKTGDCLAITFDNKTDACQSLPSPREKQAAQQFKISDYARLFREDATATVKTNEVRRLIALEKPIVVGMKIPQSFWSIQNEQQVWQPAVNEPITGFHAMVVVGYDHYHKNFELMNSFGANWGNKGFIHLGYDDFARLVDYAYVISRTGKLSDIIAKAEDDLLAGNEAFFGTANERTELDVWLTIKKGVRQNNQIEFIKTDYVYQAVDNSYESAKENWQKGDYFQIFLHPSAADLYLYVIGLDAKGAVKLLYESKQPLLANSPVLCLPEPTSAFALTENGENELCILVGKQKLSDIENKVAQLAQSSGSLPQRMTIILKDQLPISTTIHYASNELFFHSFLEKDFFVPIFIKNIVD